MNFFDNAKEKLTQAVNEHGDKVDAALDKAAAAIDDKTGGKHSDKIQRGLDKTKDALDGLDNRNDDLPDR